MGVNPTILFSLLLSQSLSPFPFLLVTLFIRKLPKEDWKRLLDTTQQTPGGGSVKWRKPQPSDGAIAMLRESKRLEIRGVPFGLRTWSHLESLLRPIGTLQKIVCNDLQTGDPNCLCMDVEVNGDEEIPRTISVAMGGGRKTRVTIAELPPPHLGLSFPFPAEPPGSQRSSWKDSKRRTVTRLAPDSWSVQRWTVVLVLP